MLQQVIDYFESINPILAAFYATLFTWGLTAAGAALVFFFKNPNRAVMDSMLGFTGGVMVAASFWSLLAPACCNWVFLRRFVSFWFRQGVTTFAYQF